jgi:hypothetical protein
MNVLIVRCANGRVVWVRNVVHHEEQLLCVDDNVAIAYPPVPSQTKTFLQAVLQHSAALQGNVQSVESIVL